MFDDVEYHKKNQLGARCEKLLNRIMFQWNLEYTEMQWSYIMCNLTKNVKVNVHFIDPLFKNIAYNTTSQNQSLPSFKKYFFFKLDCLLIETANEIGRCKKTNENVYIVILIGWKMTFIIYWYVVRMIFFVKKKILLTLFLEDTSKSQSRVSLRLVKISCKF